MTNNRKEYLFVIIGIICAGIGVFIMYYAGYNNSFHGYLLIHISALSFFQVAIFAVAEHLNNYRRLFIIIISNIFCLLGVGSSIYGGLVFAKYHADLIAAKGIFTDLKELDYVHRIYFMTHIVTLICIGIVALILYLNRRKHSNNL